VIYCLVFYEYETMLYSILNTKLILQLHNVVIMHLIIFLLASVNFPMRI